MFSMIYTIPITLIIFVGCGVSGANETAFPKCTRNWTSHDYNYKVYPIEEIKNDTGIYLEFYVKAEKDALIVFSPTKDAKKENQDIYEVVIGGYDNKKSLIRVKLEQGDNDAPNHGEENILSPTEYRQFWIRISLDGSSIYVGKKGNLSPIMELPKGKKNNIKYYGFATWGDATNAVNWVLPCSKDEMKKMLTSTLYANYSYTSAPNNNSVFLNQANITLASQNTSFPDAENVETNGTAKVTWKDERLVWELQSYNTQFVNVEYKPTWKPKIIIANGELVNGTLNFANTSSSISVSYNGSVTWTTPFSLKIPCLPKGKNPNKPRLYCPIEFTSNITQINFNFSNGTANSTLEVKNKPNNLDYQYVELQDMKQNKSKFTAELIYDKPGISN